MGAVHPPARLLRRDPLRGLVGSRPAADDRRRSARSCWRCSSGWRCSSPSARRVQDVLDDTGTAGDGLLGPVPAAIALTLLINAVYFGGAVRRRPGLVAQRPPEGPAGRAGEHHPRPRATPCVAAPSPTSGCASPASCTTSSATTSRSSASRRRRRGGSWTATRMPRQPPSATSSGPRARPSPRCAACSARCATSARPCERDDRAPEPGIADLPALAAERTASGLVTAYDVVESSPGAAQQLPAPLGAVALPGRPGGAGQHHQALDGPLGQRRAAGGGPHRLRPTPRSRCSTTAARAVPPPGRAWATSGCVSGRPACAARSRSGRARPAATACGCACRSRPTVPDPTPVLRVLIVDDQHLVRSGFRMMLSVEPDLEVVGEAANGAAALEQARALRPDVVLMDVQMPVMDGIEATRALVGRGPRTGAHPHHLRPRRLRLRRPAGRARAGSCSRTPSPTSSSTPCGPSGTGTPCSRRR